MINTLRPRQNGRLFADDMFENIFLNENVWIPIEISLACVPKVPINNIAALVQIMAWRRSGDKPLSEPMMDSLLTHICLTRPQLVKTNHAACSRDMGTRKHMKSYDMSPRTFGVTCVYKARIGFYWEVWSDLLCCGSFFSLELFVTYTYRPI